MSKLENIVNQSLSNNNITTIIDALDSAFANKNSQESEIAWSVGIIFENNLTDAFRFIPAFVEKYPRSLHPVRVLYSDLLARQGKYDAAADQARIYLRLISECKLIDDLDGKPLLLDGVSRAWLLLSSAYTEIGARSYSKRVISMGLNYSLPSAWVDVYKKELSQLNAELQSKELKALDEKWEAFFQLSDCWEFANDICDEKGLMLLKKRFELIKDNIRFNSSFSLSDEMLKLVKQNENAFELI